MLFQCDNCLKQFSRIDSLTRHKNIVHNIPTIHTCPQCTVTFTRRDNLRKHLNKIHMEDSIMKRCVEEIGESSTSSTKKRRVVESSTTKKRIQNVILCELCGVTVEESKYQAHLRTNIHKDNACANIDVNVQVIKTAFKSRIISYRITNNCENMESVEEFMEKNKETIIKLIVGKTMEYTSVKVNIELFGLYYLGSEEDKDKIEMKSFNTRNIVIDESIDLQDMYTTLTKIVIKKSEEFKGKGSGWTLLNIAHLEMNINKHNPLRGSTYIPLPKWINDKHAVVNVQNNDNACFAWAVVSALYPTSLNSNRTSVYPNYRDVLNLQSIDFPMKIKDIDKFEIDNGVSINVYNITDRTITGPIHLTKQKRDRHINLLYVEEGDLVHYCWINNMSRLVKSQITRHKTRIWLCDGCLVHFYSEQHLAEHVKYDCNKIRTFFPDENNNILRFKGFKNQLRVPFTIYADFEAILKPITTCSPNPLKPFTNVTHIHEPYSFSYFIKCSYDTSLNQLKLYRGENCAQVFMNELENDAQRLHKIMKRNIPMTPLTQLQQDEYDVTTICSICEEELDDSKVMDHDHLTGHFRGAAHQKCNLNLKIPDFIPVILHNFSNYDAHFIVKEFGVDDEKIDVIANNKERYISFTKYVPSDGESNIKLKFLDSFRFMASSLDRLSKNLKPHQFVETFRIFSDNNKFNLIKQKGIFPYEYVDCINRLDDTELPPKSAFYSSLTMTHITDEDYLRAQNIWTTFNIQTLGEYSDLYLKTDVLLLTDIFENFRDICIKTYKLDPCQYFTAPGLSWDAMLKYTKVELELFTDIDMIHFIKNSIRGGLCQCSKRYSKANNKYMTSYDPNKPSKFITYLDANNQYGWAMSNYLPINNFRWLTEQEINQLEIIKISNESDEGYILEVDLEYPANLHTDHNDLPFAPQNIIPPCTSSKSRKLIANLHDKHKYVIHYINLKQCITHGLVLKRIHRVLQFTQKPWLKPYIKLNNDLRTNSTNAFEKDFYKLMNNSVFGKTMENVDKRVDIKLITTWDNIGKRYGANSLISKPNFKNCAIIHENLVIIQMDRLKVTYNKPIYIGFTVLELSKTLMYEFHYDYMKCKFNNNCKLLYTDTDSFIYELSVDNFYEDIKSDISRFDTSEYPENNVFGIPQVNKKVLGKMKDECAGVIIDTFVGTKAKSYCVLTVDDVLVKKIKGIKKCVVDKKITLNDYVKCVNSVDSVILREMTFIRSVKHQLYTSLINKVTLNYTDDKRFIIPKSYGTLAWGNREIELYTT